MRDHLDELIGLLEPVMSGDWWIVASLEDLLAFVFCETESGAVACKLLAGERR